MTADDMINAKIEFHTAPNGAYAAMLIVDGFKEKVCLATICGNFANLESVKEAFHKFVNDSMRLDVEYYDQRNQP